ncbi:hypothetical protein ACHQM5_010961 [Ranunculus cassubicifolius]
MGTHQEIYYFTFNNFEDRKKALDLGNFHISGKLFVIRPWSPEVESERGAIKTLPLWVKFLNVPKQVWNKKGLSRLASTIGKPMFMDKATEARSILSYARVCVEVEALKELPAMVKTKVSQTKTAEIAVEYSWKPLICTKCQVFGHSCNQQSPQITPTSQTYGTRITSNGNQGSKTVMQNFTMVQNRNRGGSKQNWVERNRGNSLGSDKQNVTGTNNNNMYMALNMEEGAIETTREDANKEQREENIPTTAENPIADDDITAATPALVSTSAPSRNAQPTSHTNSSDTSITVPQPETELGNIQNPLENQTKVPHEQTRSKGVVTKGLQVWEERVRATKVVEKQTHEHANGRQKEKSKAMTEAECILARWEARQLKEAEEVEATQKKKLDAGSSLSSKHGLKNRQKSRYIAIKTVFQIKRYDI